MEKKHHKELSVSEYDAMMLAVSRKVDEILSEHLIERMGFIVLIGKGDYSGMVHNLDISTDRVINLIRSFVDGYESNRQEDNIYKIPRSELSQNKTQENS